MKYTFPIKSYAFYLKCQGKEVAERLYTFNSKAEALEELAMLEYISKNNLASWAPYLIPYTSGEAKWNESEAVNFKYEVKPEDIVNALANLEDLVQEYFNLDREEAEDERDEENGINPENRHLGEPNLIPGSTNESTTIESGRKGAAELLQALQELADALNKRGLLENLQNPNDVNDERVTNPEEVKDSDLIDHEHLPPGPIESLCEAPLEEVRQTLPGDNTDSPLDEEAEREATDVEPYSVNNGGVQSSGEAYLGTPPDVKPEEENAEEEKEKAPEPAQAEATNAEQGAETKKQSEEDWLDLEEEGGPGSQDPSDIPGNDIPGVGESDTSTNNVGWFGSMAAFFDAKALTKTAIKKGLDHFKASEDGMLHSQSYGSFSNFGKKSIEDYYPTDEELGEINANHALVNMSKEHLLVLPIVAADTEVDRGNEHFTKDALESFVPLYKGKALLLDHDWKTASEIGRVFDAKVVNDKLMVKAYIPITDHNHKLISNVLAGVHGRVSVGFSMDVRNVTCDSCACAMSQRKGPPTLNPFTEGTTGWSNGVSIFDEDLCPHKPGALDEFGNKTTVTLHQVADVMELSLVPVPMQPKAGMSRALMATKSTIKDNTSNIISSRTMGEKAVSDLTASRMGGEGAGEAMSPEAAGPFDVEGDQTRPTDDNIFARSAIKNLHDASEVIKTLTAELVESQKAHKEILDELKSMYEKACDSKKESEDEKEERMKVLEEAAKALTAALNRVTSLEASSAEVTSAKEAKQESQEPWVSVLIKDFNKSLEGK